MPQFTGGQQARYAPRARPNVYRPGVDLNADAQDAMRAKEIYAQAAQRGAAMDPSRNRLAGPPQRSMAGMMGSVAGNANPTAQYAPPPNVSGQAQQFQPPPQQAPQGPSYDQVMAEMQRRQVGAQVGANPRNAAISGYMMGR